MGALTAGWEYAVGATDIEAGADEVPDSATGATPGLRTACATAETAAFPRTAIAFRRFKASSRPDSVALAPLLLPEPVLIRYLE